MLWLLVVAQPLLGNAAVLTSLLGSRHFHKPVALALAPPAAVDAHGGAPDHPRKLAGLHDHTPAGVHGHMHDHDHAHEGLFRHRHADDDETVVVVERAVSDDADGSSSSAGTAAAPVVGALCGLPAWVTLTALSHRRPASAAAAFDSHVAALPERPPRA